MPAVNVARRFGGRQSSRFRVAAIAGAREPAACKSPIRSSSARQVLSWPSRLTGRVSACSVRTPPAQWQATATRSLSPSTVTTTRSRSSRAIACRSRAVVVGACHSAGMSSVSRRIAASSAAVSGTGRVATNRSCSARSRSSSARARSHCRSRLRATSRFSGSTASYCRCARSAS